MVLICSKSKTYFNCNYKFKKMTNTENHSVWTQQQVYNNNK